MRAVAERLEEFSPRTQDDAVWLLAEALLAAQEDIPVRGAIDFLADAVQNEGVPWNTPARFLLYAVANHPEGGARLFLSSRTRWRLPTRASRPRACRRAFMPRESC